MTHRKGSNFRGVRRTRDRIPRIFPLPLTTPAKIVLPLFTHVPTTVARMHDGYYVLFDQVHISRPIVVYFYFIEIIRIRNQPLRNFSSPFRARFYIFLYFVFTNEPITKQPCIYSDNQKRMEIRLEKSTERNRKPRAPLFHQHTC